MKKCDCHWAGVTWHISMDAIIFHGTARICCRLYVLRNSPDGPQTLSCQPLYYTFRHRLWTAICIWHGTIVAHGMILTIFHQRRLVARCERARGALPLLFLHVWYFFQRRILFWYVYREYIAIDARFSNEGVSFGEGLPKRIFILFYFFLHMARGV